MAEENYGDEGLILPVPGSKQRFNLSRHWAQNFKKLSDRLKLTFDKTTELYRRDYVSYKSPGESLNSLGSVRSGWKITSWAIDSRGYIQSMTITFERTGAAIKVPGNSNIGNQEIILLQERFRPTSSTALSSSSTGRAATGKVASDGKVILAAVGGASDIPKGYDFTLSGLLFSRTPGVAS